MASYVQVQKVNDVYTIIQNIPVGHWTTSPGNGYPDTRILYGDKNYPGDNLYPENIEKYLENRISGGFWFLDYQNDGITNTDGVDLEFRIFSHYSDEYFETGKTKPLTVIRTNHYIDDDLDNVKQQLKNNLIFEKDSRINVPYNFKSKDKKINLDFNMSMDARYNIRDAYYLQQDMKSPDVSFFIENTPIRLPKKYIKELFLEVNEFIYNILVELERQTFNIDSTDSIIDAQYAAEWIYSGKEIPERTI